MAIKDKDIYKGRQKSHRLAKTLVFSVIAVIAIAVAAFFVLRSFAVYDANGNATIVLPFFQAEEP